MSEHRLRAIKWNCARVLLICALCTTAIVNGWPL